MGGFAYGAVLTGGIATGKSTVARFFLDDGVAVVDADQIAHGVLEENAKWVDKEFGSAYIRKGAVDRKALGRLVFSDPKARKRLESYLHPLIKERVVSEAHKLEKAKKLYIVDIPLFYETKRYDFSPVIVVYAPQTLQIERLKMRDGYDTQEALRRIEAQIPIDLKRRYADYVIENTSSLEALYENYRKIYRSLKEEIGS